MKYTIAPVVVPADDYIADIPASWTKCVDGDAPMFLDRAFPPRVSKAFPFALAVHATNDEAFRNSMSKTVYPGGTYDILKGACVCVCESALFLKMTSYFMVTHCALSPTKLAPTRPLYFPHPTRA